MGISIPVDLTVRPVPTDMSSTPAFDKDLLYDFGETQLDIQAIYTCVRVGGDFNQSGFWNAALIKIPLHNLY